MIDRFFSSSGLVPAPSAEGSLGRAGTNWRPVLLIAVLFPALGLPALINGSDVYYVSLMCKYLAIALFAISVDLIWGYCGLLSLGQGLFFGIGGYMVGYSLKLQKAALDAGKPLVASPDMAVPDFMFQSRVDSVPFIMAPLIYIWVALAAAMVIPALFAGLFGWLVFIRRIKGVYFSLVTQALLFAFFYLIMSPLARPYTGSEGGLNNLAMLQLFGFTFDTYLATPLQFLYFLIAAVVLLCFVICTLLMNSKVGKILTAIRDGEGRVKALGYNTAAYKTFIFAFAGGLAGLSGALYVPANGVAGPEFFGIAESIEIVILVAVGGRGTLTGPFVGALLVSFGKTFLSSALPDGYWPIVLGGLFVTVVLFMPRGLVGLSGAWTLPGAVVALSFVPQVETRVSRGLPGDGLLAFMRAVFVIAFVVAVTVLPGMLLWVGGHIAKRFIIQRQPALGP